jgi:hypothetical protein
MRRFPVAVGMAVALVGWLGGGGVYAQQSRTADAPRWVVTTPRISPGQPASFVLDPSGSHLCWIGLYGPGAEPTVGWRFKADGRRLRLTLLTRSDASPGIWRLEAVCKRYGGKSFAAAVTTTVPAGPGQGLLAEHGDMRVEVVPKSAARTLTPTTQRAVPPKGRPAWVAAPKHIIPGQPAIFVLYPGGRGACFVGLHGPTGLGVGWRFQPNGRNLRLTLLTRPDAAPGRWQLQAKCAVGGRSVTATTAVLVRGDSGGGLLAMHGDMRVEVVLH